MIMKVVPFEPVSASCEVVLPCWTCWLSSVLALLPQSTLSPVRVQVLLLPPVVELPPLDELPEVELPDVPDDVPVDVPDDVPADVPDDVPAEVPVDVPVDVPAEVPEDVPAEVPDDVPAEVPAEVPADVPADVPAEVPDDVPAEVPVDVPAEVPAEVPESVPDVVPESVPEVVPESVPEDVPESVPAVVPESVPAVVPATRPPMMPTVEPPSVPPSEEPPSEEASVWTTVGLLAAWATPTAVREAPAAMTAAAAMRVTRSRVLRLLMCQVPPVDICLGRGHAECGVTGGTWTRSPPCAHASYMRMPRNTISAFTGAVKVIKHALGELPVSAG